MKETIVALAGQALAEFPRRDTTMVLGDLLEEEGRFEEATLIRHPTCSLSHLVQYQRRRTSRNCHECGLDTSEDVGVAPLAILFKLQELAGVESEIQKNMKEVCGWLAIGLAVPSKLGSRVSKELKTLCPNDVMYVITSINKMLEHQKIWFLYDDFFDAHLKDHVSRALSHSRTYDDIF